MMTALHHSDRPLLWREAVGDVLRRVRLRHRLRLVDVAERAGLSTQYLSELERGKKDPSSEMLAAVAGALGLDVSDVARLAADVVARSGRGVGAGLARGDRVLVLGSSVGRSAPGPGADGATVSATRDAFVLAA
jgi:transcriptional regulator with XRE-family HTH domain